jgi:hypothetical protein
MSDGSGLHMKKLLGACCFLILGMVTWAVAVSIGCVAHQKSRYNAGKDTRASYASGRYQVVECFGYSLVDMESEKALLDHVVDWGSSGDYVYAINKEGAAIVVDLRHEEHVTYRSRSDAPEEHRTALERLRVR